MFSTPCAACGMRAKSENSLDQLFDLVDLVDDGGGALVENVAIFGDPVEVAFPQPLGRKLDRGQRILDLMGDAAGDLLPGGKPLRLFQVGQVVEDDDKADRIAADRPPSG